MGSENRAHIVRFLLGTYLFVKLNKCGFEELVNVFAVVIWVLNVAQTFAHIGLGWKEISLNSSWEGV